ncbi:MAG TPA: winged helix-turn-helix domain-containing protein [Ktedonobacterales bacterium]|nr:winged helix-turn-helix domain-containing protein [Ktedonobacterales bacterium]
MGDSPNDEPEVLPEDVPVTMPELPLSLQVDTPQQMKALADPMRHRILGIIQSRPATAKQIADRLKMPPGTIGHHLQVLESAGLAQVVARRLVRGIVARYYTRTARIFTYHFPSDVTGAVPTIVRFLTEARDELAETLVDSGPDLPVKTAFPHARLTPERVAYYEQRLIELVDEFIAESPDSGMMYSLSVALFQSPSYMQDRPASGGERDEQEHSLRADDESEADTRSAE